jgi:hypothetical protein
MKPIAFILLFLFHTHLAIGSTPEDSVRTDSIQTTKTTKARWYEPQYIPIQFAGNIGLLSVGIGYTRPRDHYQLSLVYGYAPAKFAGVRIHTVTARNIFHLYRHQMNRRQTLLPFAALGLSAELGGRSFFTQPDVMPYQYYRFPKSVHAIASAGLKLRQVTPRIKGFKRLEFFVEGSTVDAYIWYKFLSKDVRFRDILSLSAGVHLMRR